MRNRSMDMMKGIAILLVVFLHSGPVPFDGVLWDWLGQGTYRLAMFLFVSGYLFKDMQWADYKDFFIRKSKHLALPLIGWNIVYAVIATILVMNTKLEFIPPVKEIWSLHNLFIEPFLTGNQYILNLATWFIGSLYLALLFYGCLSIITAKIPRWVMLVVYFGLAVLSLYLTQLPFTSHWILAGLKLMIFPFFLHLGYCYRHYCEPHMTSWLNWTILFASLILLRVTWNYGGHTFGLAWMSFEDQLLLPLLVAIFGTVMWKQICDIWVAHTEPGLIEKAFGQYSFSIMTHHLLIRLAVCSVGVYVLSDAVTTQQFYKSIWFVPRNVDFWTLTFFELTLCILWQRGFDFLCNKIKTKIPLTLRP